MSGNTKEKKSKETNGWDILKGIIDGLFSLISIGKVIPFAVIWFVIRDMIFVSRLPSDYQYAENLLKDEFLEFVMSGDNTVVVVLICIIFVLIVGCVGLIGYCFFLKNEIKRISESRKKAMHGKEKLRRHNTSDIDNKGKEDAYD